jgi:hypothetical protein
MENNVEENVLTANNKLLNRQTPAPTRKIYMLARACKEFGFATYHADER